MWVGLVGWTQTFIKREWVAGLNLTFRVCSDLSWLSMFGEGSHSSFPLFSSGWMWVTGMKSTSLSSLKDSLEEETGSVFAERVDGEVPGASTFSVKLSCCSLLQDSSPGRVESKKSVFPSEKRIGQDIWPGSFWLIILQFVHCPTIPFSRQNGHSFFAWSVYVNLSLRES